jgi:PIN domain nuclease of toxin-antitoxin system
VRLLLDTHAFLWFTLRDRQLSATAQALIADPANRVEISPASYWEIAIKIGIGKYTLSEPFDLFMEREIQSNRFQILPISVRHAAVLASLPHHHGDPFDRLLIAQAMVEQVPLLSADAAFDAYPVTRLW